MKKNITYISIVFLLLLCEIFAYSEEKHLYHAFWVSFFKVLSSLIFAIWYFQAQKKHFKRIQKVFLASNILAILINIFNYFFTLNEGLGLIYCLNIAVFLAWIYIFRSIGAKISFNQNDDLFKKLIPLFFVFPAAYYFLTLFPILTTTIAILKLIFNLTIFYTCFLSLFLPINPDKKLWITLGIILFIFSSLLYSNYLFIENKIWSYVISRMILVTSKCMMVYGMINYNKGQTVNSTEEY